MNYETKRNVFEDALRALEEFGEQGSSWEMAYDDLSARYSAASDAALPDDMPVIPEAIAKYINDMKSSSRDIWDAIHYLLRSNNIGEYMEDNSETFARAWVLGVWCVEETREIVKLEEEK